MGRYRLLGKRFIQYLLPSILIQSGFQIARLVDSIMIGQYLGTEGLAAHSLSVPIFTIIPIFYKILGAGGGTLIAIALGQHDKRRASRVFSMTMISGAVIGLLFMLVGLFFTVPIVDLITARGGAEYRNALIPCIRVALMGAPVTMVFLPLVNCMQSDNHPSLASAFIIISNLVNVVLDYVFLEFTSLGLAGAITATYLGYVIGAVVLIAYARSKNRNLRFVRPCREDVSLQLDAAKTGLPAGIIMLLMFVEGLAMNFILIERFGGSAVAIHSICYSAERMALLLLAGLTQTFTPVIGVLYGEGDPQGIRLTARRALMVGFGFVALILFAYEAFPARFVGLFGLSDPEQLQMATRALRIYALNLPFYFVNLVAISYLQTLKQTKYSIMISCVQGLVIVTGMTLLLTPVMGLDGVWIGYIINEIGTLAFVLFILRYLARKAPALQPYLPGRDVRTAENVLTLSTLYSPKDFADTAGKVEALCRDAGLSTDQAKDAGLVARQLLACVTPKQADAQLLLDIRAAVVDGVLQLRLRDDGRALNPLENPEPNAQALQKRATTLAYSRVLNCNTLSLTLDYQAQQ